MEASVFYILPHSAGGHTHLRAEHFKQWWREAYPWEQSNTPPQREHLLCLVDIVQHMWRTGGIPQDLGCTVLVLIPKGATNTQVIGLLETLWKLVGEVIDTCL